MCHDQGPSRSAQDYLGVIEGSHQGNRRTMYVRDVWMVRPNRCLELAQRLVVWAHQF